MECVCVCEGGVKQIIEFRFFSGEFFFRNGAISDRGWTVRLMND